MNEIPICGKRRGMCIVHCHAQQQQQQQKREKKEEKKQKQEKYEKQNMMELNLRR